MDSPLSKRPRRVANINSSDSSDSGMEYVKTSKYTDRTLTDLKKQVNDLNDAINANVGLFEQFNKELGEINTTIGELGKNVNLNKEGIQSIQDSLFDKNQEKQEYRQKLGEKLQRNEMLLSAHKDKLENHRRRLHDLENHAFPGENLLYN